ncbi:MAG: T9SS type A sorting domain-containing protein [Crocinitomicaceae bacterium]
MKAQIKSPLFSRLIGLLLFLSALPIHAQWTQIANPSDNGLYSVDIHESGLCVAGGIDMVKSTDWGLTWQEIIHSGPLAIFYDNCITNSIEVVNDTTIVAVGLYIFDNYPVIIRSTNSGVDWNLEFQGTFGSAQQFRAVEFYDENVGLAAGDNLLYRTTDGGDTWSYVAGSGGDQLNDIIWLSATEVIVVGANRIIRSTNGGLSFSAQFHSGKIYKSISEQPGTGKLYACYNQNGDTYQSISTNGGLSWTDALINEYEVIYSHQVFDGDSIFYGFDNSVQVTYNEGADMFLNLDYPWSAVRDLTFNSGVGLLVAGVLADAEIYRYDFNSTPNLVQLVDFSFQDTICVGVPATYEPDHKSCDNWEWLVNGVSVSNDTSLIYTHPTAGNTQIDLVTVYHGVYDTVTKFVNVIGAPVPSAFTVTSDTMICEGEAYTFIVENLNDQNGYQVYQNGSPISPTSQSGNTVNYNVGTILSNTEFILHKWVINECDSVAAVDTFNLLIENYGDPSTSFYLEDTLFCYGDATTLLIPSPETDYLYHIYKNGYYSTTVSNATGDTIFYPTGSILGTTPFYIEVESPLLGCANMLNDTVTVYLDDVSATFYTPADILTNDTIIIGSFPVTGSIYDWSASGSPLTFEDTTSLNPIIAYDSTGVYTISLVVETAALGCVDSNTVTINVYDPVPDSTTKKVCWAQEMNLPHRVMDKHVDLFGNLIVVGFYEDTTAWPYPNYLASIQKYDPDGNVIWSWYEDPNEVDPNDDHHSSMIGSVTTDSQGNLYLTGTVHGESFKYSYWNLYYSFSSSDNLTFIMKLDSSGNFLWWVRNTETLAGQHFHGGGFSDVAVIEQENKLLVPCVASYGPFEFTNSTETVSSQGFNVFILDLDGNYINHLNANTGTYNIKGEESSMSTNYSGNRVHTSPEVFVGDNGEAYLVGEWGDGYFYFGNHTLISLYQDRSGFIAKMNYQSSTPSWIDAVKTFECSQSSAWPYWYGNRTQHMTFDSDYNIYQSVNHSGNFVANGDTTSSASGSVILKFDGNLNYVWRKNFSMVYLHDVFCTNDEDLYFEGVLSSSLKVYDGTQPEYFDPLQGSQNIYFGSLSATSSDLTWLKQFGQSDKEFVDPIGGNSCGDVYFSGQSATAHWELASHSSIPFDLNGISYGPLNGAFMFKLTDSVCVSGGCNTLCLDSTLFPSPVITSNAGVLETGNFATYQWYLNGNLLNGMTNQTLVPIDTGYYSVLVTNVNGCSGQSSDFDLCSHSDYYPSPVITASNGTLSTGQFSTYQWFLDGLPIPGATQQTLYFTANGNYNVEVTNQIGCKGLSSSPFVVSNLSTKHTENDFQLYPNPTHDLINVFFYTQVPNKVEITNLSGKSIQLSIEFLNNNSLQLDLSHLEDGVYLLHLFWDDESQIVKIVKM